MKLLLEPEIRTEHKEEPGSCFGDSNDQVQGHLACSSSSWAHHDTMCTIGRGIIHIVTVLFHVI